MTFKTSPADRSAPSRPCDSSARAHLRQHVGPAHRVASARRGSVLVLVIGVLALLAIVIVVYTTIGQADVRAGRTVLTKATADEQSRAIGRYIAQIVGDDATKTFSEADAATGVTRLVRQSWDYPLTDPEVVSIRPGNGVPGAVLNDNEWRARRFNPVGAQRHAWIGTGPLDVDPRTPSDPWLASTEPLWLNADARRLTGNQVENLGLWHNDWSNLSLVSPDGRVVNLSSLRGNFFAEPGFGNDAQGRPRTSANLERLARSGGGGGNTPTFQWDTTIPANNAAYNRPATWASNQVGLAIPRALGSAEPAGSTRFLDNMFADADGDGLYDSRWQELVDAGVPNQPQSVLARTDDLRIFIAPRVIDLSGLVNVNTAASFSDPFGLLHDGGTNDATRGDNELYDPLLPIGRTTTGAQRPNGALRAAPVRYRYTLSIDPANNLVGADRGVGQRLNRGLVADSAAGLTPADIDLERLLTGYDAMVYFGRDRVDHFGPDGASFDQYNSLTALNRPAALERLAIVGGAGFSSLITARELGLASRLSASDPYGEVTNDFFQPGRLIFPVGAGQTQTIIEGNLPANSPEYQHKLFITARDRQALYALSAEGGRSVGARQSLSASNNNPGGQPVPNFVSGDVLPIGFAGSFSRGDERELRAFGGVNDPTSQSRLEVAVDGRSIDALQSAWGPLGALRSQRTLLADRDAVDTPDASIKRRLQGVTDVRRLLTTVSGARPLGGASRRYFPAGTNNAQPVPEFGIGPDEVKLDAGTAVQRAISGDRSGLSDLFTAYAETFLPLSSMQYDDDAWRSGSGYNLWAERNVSEDNRRRTSVTQFGGGLLLDERAQADVDRLVPAANSELALQTAAHMALNMMAWRDGTGTSPIAATLLLNERERDFMPGGTQAGPLGRTTGTGVPLYPFWPTTALNLPGAAVRTFALDFSNKTDTLDLNRDGNRADLIQRLNRDATPPDTRAKAINLYAVQPQPVLTQVSSFVMYTDASRVAGATDGELFNNNGQSLISSAATLEGFNNAVSLFEEQARQEVDNAASEFEYARIVVRSTAGFGTRTRNYLGQVKIDGLVQDNNRDFLIEVVGIQITNPFDVPISLSGQLNAQQAELTRTANAGINAREPGSPMLPGDTLSNDNFSYYVEFAGRYYRLARYSDVAAAGAAPLDAIVLGPRETLVFFIPGESLDKVAERWTLADSSFGAGGSGVGEVRRWINTQMGVRIFDANGTMTRLDQPIRLLPFDPRTGVDVVPSATDGVGVMWPQTAAIAASSTAVPSWMISGDDGALTNRVVRLWRAVRTDTGVSGGTRFEEVVTLDNAGNPPLNRLENDQLVDVLRDSNVREGTLSSIDRRLAMGVTGAARLGAKVRVSGTASEPGAAGDNTGYSILMTGGFRRADDPRGGPAPDDLAAPSFPRGAMPAWTVETKPGLFSSSSALTATPLQLRSRNTNRGMVRPSAAWQLDPVASNGGPEVYQPRGLTRDRFLTGPETAGTGASIPDRAVFLSREFRNITGASLWRLTSDAQISSLSAGATNPIAKTSLRESTQWELTRHPAVKSVSQPVVNRGSGSLPDDSPQDDNDQQAAERRATWIDRTHLDRPAAFTGQGVAGNASRPSTNTAGEVEGTQQGQVYDQLYAHLPLAPRPVVAPADGAPRPLQERPELPQLRAGDVLMPWAIGPSWAPGAAGAGVTARRDVLDAEWTTLGEAMALALDYATPTRRNGTTSVEDVDSAYFRAGLVLDRCRLRLDAPVPFSDVDADGKFPLRTNINRPVATLGGGVPMAMALLDRMRAGGAGDRTQRAPGVININTAPLSVLRMLPMVASLDVTEQTLPNFALRSWMTWGPQRSIANIETYRDAPFSSSAGDLPSVANLSQDQLLDLERARLRGRQETIWDVASSILAYRDKLGVHTMPSQDGRTRFIADFAEGNDTTYNRTGPESWRDNARRAVSGITGLREQRGFRSVGELLAVRVRDQFRPNPANPGDTLENFRPRNELPDLTGWADGFDPKRDMTTEAQLSIDRFARDKQPADYTMNQATSINAGELAVEQDFQVPLALSSFATPRALSLETRDATRPANASQQGGNPRAYQRQSFSNLRPGSVSDEYEEQMLIANSVLNNVSVRSDVFAVYFVMHGYRPSDVEGLTRDIGDTTGSFAAPMIPSLKRRFVMVVDRSNVVNPGDQPKVLMFDELPAD